MNLATSGREYAHFPVALAATTALSASFDGGVTWAVMERPSDTEARVLVAGPEATSNPVGTVVLQAGRNPALIRLTAGQESVIRPAGGIFVTPASAL